MKKLIFIPLILGMALSACQSMPNSGDTADANAVKLVSVNDNAVDTDADELVITERLKESIDEADRTDPDVGPAFAALDKEFEGRIAGRYVKHEPTYTYVLQLKGLSQDTARMIKIFDANNPKKFEWVPLELKYGAKFTEKEAIAQIDEAVEFLNGYFPSSLRMVSYNPETLMLNADVKGEPTSENLALLEAVKANWGKDKLPIQINFVNYSIVPL